MTMKSSFYPVIGDKIFGWMGDAIDTISVATTLFGVCTSLGLGVIQLNSGAARLFKSCITGVSCFDIMFACARQCIAAHAWLLRRTQDTTHGHLPCAKASHAHHGTCCSCIIVTCHALPSLTPACARHRLDPPESGHPRK